jgi:E2F-associated phosphoprotein.
MNIERINDDAAIVSGSDVPHDPYDSSSEEDDGADDPLRRQHGEDDDPISYHYNPDQDEEDEAYVYRHLRGGTEETVTIRRRKRVQPHSAKGDEEGKEGVVVGGAGGGSAGDKSTKQDRQSGGSKDGNEIIDSKMTTEPLTGKLPMDKFTIEQAKILKPRYSDAVLSCPCCLQIVCMDCQRHERYSNQYRAMFVMNIGVCWDAFVVPEMKPNEHDTRRKRVVSNQVSGSNEISNQENASDQESDNEDDERVYYSVHCNNCMTEVAALDMRDEVYYFFGCVASA